MSPVIHDWLLDVATHCVRADIMNRPEDERAKITNPDYIKSVILGAQDDENTK